MKMYDLITKKKTGDELSREEIRELVFAYTRGEIPDYQVAAWLMAVYFRGMSDGETVALTEAITESGATMDLSRFGRLTADKHSSGGVGDKTTLIVAPLAAAMGCKVAKMTGRGLGHTGGTADKLESIKGFRTTMTTDEFMSQVEEIGVAVIAQNVELAPADKKIYALRDVTATVDSIPLIVSSIMGKKLAAGSKNIILDVKYGSGAFMKSAEDALVLAKKMVTIGNACGRNTRALITNMNEPLGYAVGNSLEVEEAIATLKGKGPADLTEICIELAAHMAACALGITENTARELARNTVRCGAAYEKFLEWIGAQGAVPHFKLEKAKYITPVYSEKDGYISAIDAEEVGLCALALGAGRATKDDVIDHAAGIILVRKVGDRVLRGDIIAYLHTNREAATPDALKRYLKATSYSKVPPKKSPLIYECVDH